MTTEEYIVSFYAIFVGVSAATILTSWARILRKYPNVSLELSQVLFSITFLLLLVQQWLVDSTHFEIESTTSLVGKLAQPTFILFIGYLLIPSDDERSAFQAQKIKIGVLAIVLTTIVHPGFRGKPELTLYGVQFLLILLFWITLSFDRNKIVWIAGSAFFLVFWLVFLFGLGEFHMIPSIVCIALFFIFYGVYKWVTFFKKVEAQASEKE